MSDDPHTSPSEAFLRVLRGLLRPLVRTMIARGLTAPVIYSLLKRVFVEVAEESFRLDDKPLTDSRIALLTGVHRKDIRMIRAEGAGDGPVARRKSAVLATVVGQWMSQPEYSDGGGPRALPRSAAEDVDFEALVRSVNTDVRPRTVLDELLRAGLVRQDAQDMLHLQTDAVVGASTTGDREVFFAANVGDHLAAATENLLAAQPPFFERSVFYNQMTPEAVDEVEAAARVQAQAMLEDLNRRSSALHRRDKDSDAARQRYRVGVYFYKEDAAPVPPEEGQDTP
ncbi:DUF6502 family protein [uncultured Tateyamaria sp.]|uniref:DUF6502 family protein n=1 Tax=uncultured Tateyamaria sp. TaxID=455651 RepID=UPI00261FA771|nr:DUF6502 family protein [uncultured Tateyamaria sp.]